MCGPLILPEQVLPPVLFHAQPANRSCRSFPSSQSNHSLKSPSSAGVAQSSQRTSEETMMNSFITKKKGKVTMESNIHCDPGATEHSTLHRFRKTKVCLQGWTSAGPFSHPAAPRGWQQPLHTLYGCDGSPSWKASFPCYLLLQNILNDKF